VDGGREAEVVEEQAAGGGEELVVEFLVELLCANGGEGQPRLASNLVAGQRNFKYYYRAID